MHHQQSQDRNKIDASSRITIQSTHVSNFSQNNMSIKENAMPSSINATNVGVDLAQPTQPSLDQSRYIQSLKMLTEAIRIKLFTHGQQMGGLYQQQEMNGTYYMHVTPGGFNLQTLQMDYYLIIKSVKVYSPESIASLGTGTGLDSFIS